MLHPREDSEVIICPLTQEIRGQKSKQNKKICFFCDPRMLFKIHTYTLLKIFEVKSVLNYLISNKYIVFL